MDNITNPMTTLIAQAAGRRRSGIAMPIALPNATATCGHAAEWTRVDSVKADMGLVQGYFPGNRAWRPPIS